MRFWLKLTGILLTVVATMTLVSWGIHTLIAHRVIQEIPNQLKRISPAMAQINYDGVLSENCLFKICLKAENVQIIIPQSKQTPLYFGTLTVQKSLFSGYHIQTKTSSQNNVSPSAIYVDLNTTGTLYHWQIEQLNLAQKQFKAELNGSVDVLGKALKLQGKSLKLATFVKQFIPPDLGFMANLILSNDWQDIFIRSDENYIRIQDIPVMPNPF